ncbi:MAG: diaminopimelate epimerase [Candidatus Omnitrophica bacterium]|nr:diaminopimelate epimerase [Candidatus Omnitrophota bacterium]
MRKIEFSKMVASGNDFVLIDRFKTRLPLEKNQISKLAKEVCQRKHSIGADGLLLIEPSKKADFKLRIFNPDGSEVDMCGNGSRCAALYAAQNNIGSRGKKVIETLAGNLFAQVKKEKVKIKMTRPKDIRLRFSLDVDGNTYNVNYINTGVPHVVCFVQSLDKISVGEMGRAIRYHSEFQPQGTNANFVEVLSKGHIKLRTYERGVEEETLACGTGCVASGIITTYDMQNRINTGRHKVRVSTKGGETLSVYFKVIKDKTIDEVFLEGKAKLVYEGKLSK